MEKKFIKLNLSNIFTESSICFTAVNIFIVLNTRIYKNNEKVRNKDFKILALNNRFYSRSYQVMLDELCKGNTILISINNLNNIKSCDFLCVDFDNFIYFFSTDYLSSYFYINFISSQLLSIKEILARIISTKSLEWIFNNLEMICKIFDKYENNFDKTSNGEQLTSFYELLSSHYQLDVVIESKKVFLFDEEIQDWLFKILIKILEIENYVCINSDFAVSLNEHGLGNLKKYIVYFLFSSKLKYAEMLSDKFIKCELNLELLFSNSSDMFCGLLNVDSNFSRSINVDNKEFSLDEKRHLIILYDKLFGAENKLSILLSLTFDELKNKLQPSQKSIFSVISEVIDLKDCKINKNNILSRYYHYLKGKISEVEIFVTLFKLKAVDVIINENDKAFIDKLADVLNLNIDLTPFIKDLFYNGTLSKNLDFNFTDLSFSEIAFAILLNNALYLNEKSNGYYETEIVYLLSVALKFVTNSKNKARPFTILLSEIMHISQFKIKDITFEKICILIMSAKLANKTKKELLFGYNMALTDSLKNNIKLLNFKLSYYYILFGYSPYLYSEKLFGYSRRDIAYNVNHLRENKAIKLNKKMEALILLLCV